MTFLRIFKTVFLAIFLVAWNCLAYDFAPGEFEELRDVSLEVLMKYPPSEYYYVTVGRSPGAIERVLEFYSPHSTIPVPISGVKGRPGVSSKSSPPLSELEEQNLFQAWARLKVPTSEQLGGKKLLLIDYTQEAKGLISAYDYLGKYCGKGCRLEALALPQMAFEKDPLLPHNRKRRTIHVLDMKRRPILRVKLGSRQYKGFSTYGRFDPTQQTAPTAQDENLIADFIQSLHTKLIQSRTSCMSAAFNQGLHAHH